MQCAGLSVGHPYFMSWSRRKVLPPQDPPDEQAGDEMQLLPCRTASTRAMWEKRDVHDPQGAADGLYDLGCHSNECVCDLEDQPYPVGYDGGDSYETS